MKTYIETEINPKDGLFGRDKVDALEKAVSCGFSKATKIKVIVLIEYDEVEE